VLEFDWDPAKARKNLRDHGISFDEAVSVFSERDAEVIELISARKATRSERAQYGARWLK
jgi:uncharacterized DUF497 family protein